MSSSSQEHEQDKQRTRLVMHIVGWQSAARLAVAFAIAAVVLLSIQQIIHALILLLAAISIAQALSPLVGILQRWMPRTLSVLVIYLVFILFVVGLVSVALPRVISQVQSFVEAAPGYIDQIRVMIDRWNVTDEDIWGIGTTVLERVGTAMIDLPLAIAGAAFEIFLVLAISLYWLLAAPSMMRFALSLFSEDRQEKAESVLIEMGQTMGGYVRGQALVSLMIGLATYIGLTIIGVQYAILLAFLAAALEIVPNIGPVLATIPMVSVALLDSPQQALIVFIFWVVIQQLEAYVVTPNVLHHQADVPPLLILLALFTGGAVYGLIGAIVAIPVAGALRVFVIRVVAPRIREAWSASEGSETAA